MSLYYRATVLSCYQLNILLCYRIKLLLLQGGLSIPPPILYIASSQGIPIQNLHHQEINY